LVVIGFLKTKLGIDDGQFIRSSNFDSSKTICISMGMTHLKRQFVK